LVIHIASIEIHGKSRRGDFIGRLEFSPGLQIISGRNEFGKSLAVESIAWCLGLEAIFGRKDSDPTFFPEAVLEELNLPDEKNVPVLSSEAQLTIRRTDGEEIELTRAITHDQNKIRIVRRAASGTSQMTLLTGRGSMVDEATGFQRFLFEWLGWPAEKITTFDGSDAYIYLENLAPLFYIEQGEGWTEIQARQIGRYGQQQIRELSIEYLLGALDTVEKRVMSLRAATLDSTLRTTARGLAERATQLFLKQGWAVDWSGSGSVKEIEARWSSETLQSALQRDANVDIAKMRDIAIERLGTLRRILTKDPVDPSNVSASSSASQLVVDLKQRRHKLNSELRTLRGQYSDSEHLLDSLVHRIRTATDVHRLKTTGVGRLAHLECPTCHRELDIDAFQLTEQTAPEVQAHIEALKRDRALTRRTLDAIGATIRATEAQIAKIDGEFHIAERALEDVSASVGPVREQIVNAAANLAAQERLIEKLDRTSAEIKELQTAIEAWLRDAKAAHMQDAAGTDIEHRTSVFNSALGQYLLALGHSAAKNRGVATLRLDQGQYEPYLGDRRLRSLGSGSDPARLVGAYTLALASASATLNGLHPGFVILDEPLQQNPDTDHVTLFLDFLSKQLAKEAKFQTLVFTFLNESQVQKLRESGTKVVTVEGYLLGPVSRAPSAETLS
jgi:AAA domain-containing protein